MYIYKELMTSYGVPATYHVLKEIHTYYDDGFSHVNIAGYFSKEAFESHSIAVVINQIEIDKTVFDSTKDIYEAILSSTVFSDGVLYENEAE